MKTPSTCQSLFVLLLSIISITAVRAADAPPTSDQIPPAAAQVAAPVELPPLPEPMDVPKPGPDTGAPYAPQAIVAGGVVITSIR